jgi:hypothetical protein
MIDQLNWSLPRDLPPYLYGTCGMISVATGFDAESMA